MVDLPDALDEIRNPDPGSIAELYALLGGADFRAFLGKWIAVSCERTPP
jgi:hypothetical protein